MTEKLEYFLLLIFYYLSKLVGFKISSFIGGTVLYLYGKFSPKNEIAFKNLSRVYPKKTKGEKKKIISKMWFHFGRVIGEYPHLENIRTLNNSHIKIENLTNLTNALKNNKNCIFFSAHIGNWELTSHPLTESGHKISFIYRPPNNRLVDNLLRKIRSKYGVELIKKGPEGAKQCISVLRSDKGNIGMLIDQKMNDGIESNFFGYKVMTASAIAKFSLKFKCPIVPAICRRNHGTNFIIKYYPEISYQDIKKLKTEANIVNSLNKYIENWIKSDPEQWIWVHNRWND